MDKESNDPEEISKDITSRDGEDNKKMEKDLIDAVDGRIVGLPKEGDLAENAAVSYASLGEPALRAMDEEDKGEEDEDEEGLESSGSLGSAGRSPGRVRRSPDRAGRSPAGFKYRQSLKLLLPVRLKPTRDEYSPLDHCGFFSFVWLSWMSGLFYKAYKRRLEYTDLWTMSDSDRGQHNGERFERLWEEELKRKGEVEASLGRVAMRFVSTRLIISVIALVISTLATFIISAVLVEKLLAYIEAVEVDVWYGIVLVLSILVLNVVRICGDVFFWVCSCRTATRLRSGVLALSFQRLAHLRSLQNHSVGEIVNVCTNDSQRLFDACITGNFLISAVVMFVAATIATQLIVGIGALIGTIATFTLFFPVQMLLGRAVSMVRIKCIRITDKRVQKMNEILTFVKLIKMYAWEKPFAKTIAGIRSLERRMLEKAGLVQSYSISIIPVIPSLAAVSSILIHVAMGNHLSASKAFTLVALLNVMRVTVGPTPFAVRMLAESSVALQRLKNIIILDKIQPNAQLADNSDHMVEICNGTFGWDVVQGETEKQMKDDEQKKEEGEEKEEDENTNHIKRKKKSNGSKYQKVSSDSVRGNGVRRAGRHEQSNTLKLATLPGGLTFDPDKVSPSLFGIDFQLRKGTLTGVCGLVGSGKSSLISAILGQMQTLEGTCRVAGRLAYVSQEAWIFNATVQENILFGAELDVERYEMVLSACSLKQDLEVLTDGDQTEIGERGINLSGGQKQRVSLARAVYADRDVYLLDDPLSAVDAHVGEHIFRQCIMGVLKGKTILFVTHRLQYLQDCSCILVMANGRIVEHGHHGNLMEKKGGEYARLISTHYMKEESEEEEAELITKQSVLRQRSVALSVVSETDSQNAASINSDCQLRDAEMRTDGGPQWGTYHGYIQAMGGYNQAFFLLLAFVLLVGVLVFNNWWLGYWIETSNARMLNLTNLTWDEEPSLVDDPNLGFYMLIYAVSLLVVFLLAGIKSAIYMKLTIRASSQLHKDLYQRVMSCPMSFFDATPTGRIINRFSKDIDELDVMLPINLEIALMNTMVIAAAIFSISVIFPYFLIVVVPLLVVIYAIFTFYRRGVNDLKQLENVSRSPWFSHIGSTALGLNTIHAYGKTDEVITKFMDLLDVNAYPLMLFRMATRWAGARMELLVVTIVTITNLMVVLRHGAVAPSFAGLAVSYAMQLTGLFQFTMSMFTDAEARFLSAERILQYNKHLKAEACDTVPGQKPDKDWPSSGAITFSRYKMRYRDNLPLVLKSISCSIRAGEKIGIVGRTGSGKSSLSVALFRLVEASEGSITIDGVDVSSIGLTELRSKISIIPQDPVLFIGTVRYNLDPFSERSDDQLWEALEKAYMKDKISCLEYGLESLVTEGGDNFSVGERQLLCMARALLRNSKILFLDEATAAIDTETDSLIQQTIRTAFSGCTTLTIAHRLNTVLDSDRILVMDDGRVAEFDSPSSLRSNPNSLLSKMVSAAESAHSNSLP